MIRTAISLFGSVAIIASTVSGEPDARAGEPEVRTLRVPGTVVEVEVVRVDVGDKPIWVARTEVTWDLYDVYLYALDVPEGEEADAISRPSKPYVPPDRGMGHAGYPAMGMTRQAAEAFCAWLSERTGLAARLPSPGEFTEYASLPGDAAPEDAAWMESNSARTTHRVGRKAPNMHGLHDTLGNLAEWVTTEGRPVAMGGSYRDPPEVCTPQSVQRQERSWNQSDPQIPKSQWWLADCSWVGFRFVIEEMPDEPERPADD